MKKLTIIIPTNNRPEFIRRSVRYWNNYNFPIIIADGSSNSQKKWMDLNANKNIEYFHKKIPFPKRLSIAAKLIKTKYTILLCDDEFYAVDSLKKCVNFLELNNDFVAVNGRAIGFKKFNNELVFYDIYPKWAGRKRLETDLKKRMISHMQDYANTLGVSVIKSSLWTKCADFYSNNEFPIFAQWEIQMNLFLSFAGKSKTLDTLMHFRSLENLPIPNIINNHIPSLNLKNKIKNFWYEPEYENEKKRYIAVMTNFLKKLRSGYESDYYKDALINSIEKYILQCKSDKRKRTFIENIISFLKKIIRLIVKILFRYELHKFKKLEEQMTILKNKNISVNYNDLNQIISEINSGNNKK
jgi:glycosyltransferase domain-containing protein